MGVALNISGCGFLSLVSGLLLLNEVSWMGLGYFCVQFELFVTEVYTVRGCGLFYY